MFFVGLDGFWAIFGGCLFRKLVVKAAFAKAKGTESSCLALPDVFGLVHVKCFLIKFQKYPA